MDGRGKRSLSTKKLCTNGGILTRRSNLKRQSERQEKQLKSPLKNKMQSFMFTVQRKELRFHLTRRKFLPLFASEANKLKYSITIC